MAALFPSAVGFYMLHTNWVCLNFGLSSAVTNTYFIPTEEGNHLWVMKTSTGNENAETV